MIPPTDTGSSGGGSGGGFNELDFCNSFSADTLVSTTDGDIPIAEVELGDMVYAYNPETGEVGEYSVLSTISHKDEEIKTTPWHLFYTDEGWIETDDLEIGDLVLSLNGEYGAVDQLIIVDEIQVMYDLTVDIVHTFAVGDGEWVVHNCDVRPTGQHYGTDQFSQVAIKYRELLRQNVGLQHSRDGNVAVFEISDLTTYEISQLNDTASYTGVIIDGKYYAVRSFSDGTPSGHAEQLAISNMQTAGINTNSRVIGAYSEFRPCRDCVPVLNTDLAFNQLVYYTWEWTPAGKELKDATIKEIIN